MFDRATQHSVEIVWIHKYGKTWISWKPQYLLNIYLFWCLTSSPWNPLRAAARSKHGSKATPGLMPRHVPDAHILSSAPVASASSLARDLGMKCSYRMIFVFPDFSVSNTVTLTDIFIIKEKRRKGNSGPGACVCVQLWLCQLSRFSAGVNGLIDGNQYSYDSLNQRIRFMGRVRHCIRCIDLNGLTLGINLAHQFLTCHLSRSDLEPVRGKEWFTLHAVSCSSRTDSSFTVPFYTSFQWLTDHSQTMPICFCWLERMVLGEKNTRLA